jgi:hypothetical protein
MKENMNETETTTKRRALIEITADQTEKNSTNIKNQAALLDRVAKAQARFP